MEAFVFIFVIGLFIFLHIPVKKPDPPSSGDLLMKGLKAAYKDLTGPPPAKSDSSDEPGPWTVIWITILVGLSIAYFS
ncbi:MAG: hypothetical protein AAFX01_12605 [Cyanobacteria bacterium J06638_28]